MRSTRERPRWSTGRPIVDVLMLLVVLVLMLRLVSSFAGTVVIAALIVPRALCRSWWLVETDRGWMVRRERTLRASPQVTRLPWQHVDDVWRCLAHEMGATGPDRVRVTAYCRRA